MSYIPYEGIIICLVACTEISRWVACVVIETLWFSCLSSNVTLLRDTLSSRMCHVISVSPLLRLEIRLTVRALKTPLATSKSDQERWDVAVIKISTVNSMTQHTWHEIGHSATHISNWCDDVQVPYSFSCSVGSAEDSVRASIVLSDCSSSQL